MVRKALSSFLLPRRNKMHKILKYLVFIISFFAFNMVYASEINIKLGDEIEGYKVH